MQINMTELQLNKQREHIATLLKNQRIYLQLTQEEVAVRADFSPRTIQRLETGKMWLGLKQFVQYCTALEIDIVTLMRRQLNTHGENSNAKLPQNKP